jgi:putative pre-16S rRNA nuclease
MYGTTLYSLRFHVQATPTEQNVPTSGPPWADTTTLGSDGDAEVTEAGRVLGIDLGERRIGVALSDPTRTLAQPHPTLKRRAGKRWPISTMVDFASTHGVTDVVVGLPLALSGDETEWCATVREVGDEIGRRANIPVHYIDERMTSVRAERAVRSLGLPKHKREQKGRIDAAAAVLILQAWLDRETSS